MRGWISVKEKLPEQIGWYLVCVQGWVTLAWYDGTGWIDLQTCVAKSEQITHWTFLPEPPNLEDRTEEKKMRLIDVDEIFKYGVVVVKNQCDLNLVTDLIGMIKDAPAIDPVYAAGGCYCRECRYQSHDQEYGKRWCNRESGCREVRSDGQGYCDLGVQMDLPVGEGM